MRVILTTFSAALALFLVSPAAAGPFSLKGAVTGGQEYKAEAYGVTLKFPKGWIYRETSEAIFLGSNTEPGLIAIWTSANLAPQSLAQEFQEALAEVGMFSLGTPATTSAKGRKFLAWDATGQGGGGGEAGARLIAVVSSNLAVLIAGAVEGPDSEHKAMSARVNAIARSVRFSAAASGGNSMLVGQWWSYSGGSTLSGSGGTERTIAFCSDGRFLEQSESSYSGTDWGVAGQGGSAGRWRSTGNARQGVVFVTNPDGSSYQGQYEFRAANELVINGRVYGRVEPTLCR